MSITYLFFNFAIIFNKLLYLLDNIKIIDDIIDIKIVMIIYAIKSENPKRKSKPL
jgi:hypothetical protein